MLGTVAAIYSSKGLNSRAWECSLGCRSFFFSWIDVANVSSQHINRAAHFCTHVRSPFHRQSLNEPSNEAVHNRNNLSESHQNLVSSSMANVYYCEPLLHLVISCLWWPLSLVPLEVGFCWEPCISSLLVLYLGLLSGLEQSIYNSSLKQKTVLLLLVALLFPEECLCLSQP